MEVKIIDFDKKYSIQIYQLQVSQWGVWDNEAPIEEVGENDIILIALCNNEFAGVITGQLEEDVFHILICCIKPEFQKMKIGTMLFDELMKRAKEKFKFSKFMAEAISVYGKVNAKRLLENFNFQMVRFDERYW